MALDLCFVHYLRVITGDACLSKRYSGGRKSGVLRTPSDPCEIYCPVDVRTRFSSAWTIASAEHAAEGVLVTTVISCQ